METIQEVQAYLKREKSGAYRHRTDTPEGMMLDVLDGLATKCQSVEEFVEKAQRISVTGAGIEQVNIANEYREIVLEAIQG